MRRLCIRGVLLGIAVFPAAFLLSVATETRVTLVQTLGAFGLIACFVLLACIAIHFSSQHRKRHAAIPEDPQPVALLTGRSRRALQATLPPAIDQRQAVDQHLARHGTISTHAVFGKEPESRDSAITRVVRLIADTWHAPTTTHMTPDQVTDIFVLEKLLRASPEEAGALAQMFRDPSRVLEIRDQIAALARQRSQYEQQRDAFSASWALWRTQTVNLSPLSLIDDLAAMAHPDPDLWHKVIEYHDPDDKTQRDAALWCALQPDCDRASVALFLARIAGQSTLVYAAETGDRVYLDGVHQVIRQWNEAMYQRHELALDPPEAVMDAAKDFHQALADVADILDQPEWPMPKSAFTEYAGRAPLPRSAWDIADGGLMRKPVVSDYMI